MLSEVLARVEALASKLETLAQLARLEVESLTNAPTFRSVHDMLRRAGAMESAITADHAAADLRAILAWARGDAEAVGC